MAKSKQQKSKSGQKPEQADVFNCILPTDYSDSQSIKKMTEQVFRTAARSVRELRVKNPRLYQLLDVDSTRRKRRQAATLRTMKTVQELVGEICPDAEPQFYIAEEWAKINAAGLSSYDLLDQTRSLTLGAAVWMLDQIRESGDWFAALELLPMNDEVVDAVYLPDVYDPCFGDELLHSMVYVIQERNRDCTAGAKNSQSGRVFVDDCTAAGRQHQAASSRLLFESLLAMIDKDAIQTATAHFEEKLWEWVRRYFTCRADTAQREGAHAKKYNAFVAKAQRELQSMRQKVQEKRRQQTAEPGSKSVLPLAAPGTDKAPLWAEPSLPKLNTTDPLQLAISISKEGQRLEDEREALEDEIHSLLYDMSYYCNAPRDYLEETMGALAAEQITGFDIDDPYELCFALLYLLDTGSDLPWLYYPGVSIMKCADTRLPWFFGSFDEEESEFWRKTWLNDDITSTRKAAEAAKRYHAPEPLDWYPLRYVQHIRGERTVELSNLAQIVYSLTGCIPPRNTHRFDAAVKELAQYGITGKKMVVPLLHCLSLLGEGRSRLRGWQELEPDDEDSSAAEAEASAAADTPEEDSQETIRRLKSEVEQLRKSLHEATRETRDARRKLEAQAESWERDRQELQDFRELFFRQGEDEASAAPASDGIVYPYQTKKRTVVFGGHDSWAKVIKPMLPEVRFVPRELLPNPDLIRHADVVWIQPNALAHKHYYKIVDVARTYHIPVRYFGYASAEKCAEQLVEADEK